jgi:hypothetical protein
MEWAIPVRGLQEGTLHPSPQNPALAKPLCSEGWNFKLTQIFQLFWSVFQRDIYVG